MKKMLLLLAIVITVYLTNIRVFALNYEDIDYYTNDNGITLTQKEFDFVNEFYGEDYFNNMTQEDYDWITDLNINTTDVEIETYHNIGNINSSNNGRRKSTSHATNYKKISIAKSCSDICTVVTNVQWYVNPTTRSYDIIGYRFVNTSLAGNTIITKVVSTDGTTYFSNNRVFVSGLGCSVKLPNSATNISIQQKIHTTPGGYIYASYQHAISNITLETSKQYTIGTAVGNVFNLYGNAVGKFDQMGGVEISL